MSIYSKGHTLIELLIAMSLSMLIILALIQINMLSLKSLTAVQSIEKQVNLLSQSLKLLETDLKATALTGCVIDKTLIINRLATNGFSSPSNSPIQWISGYSNDSWHPLQPIYTNSNNLKSIDAIHLLKADMTELLSVDNLNRNPERIVFITNCSNAEITRSNDSTLLKPDSGSSEIFIYAFQFIHYYIKDNQGKQTLYRQYIAQSGNSVSEPLVDYISMLKIGYGERLANNALAFHSAEKVGNWANVTAVYISITLADAIQQPLSMLISLNNHIQDHE